MIGIFGGTFDPVHNGHLKTVAHVQQALNLEQVRLIPVGQAVHREQPLASAEQRINMLCAAVEANAKLLVDDREISRPGGSYTVETLQSLKQDFPDETLCLIIGSDAFAGFPDWHQPETILQLSHLIVMQRPNDKSSADSRIDKLLQTHQVSSPQQLSDEPAGYIFFQQVPQLDISSTEIRLRLQQEQPVGHMLPLAVYDLIQQWGLYSSHHDQPET